MENMALEYKKNLRNLSYNGREKIVVKNGLSPKSSSTHSTEIPNDIHFASGNKTPSPIKKRGRIGQDTSSSDEDYKLQVPSGLWNGSPPGWVFQYYKKFGQYWEVFPKTDYTYLPSSPYNGRAIAPGIPVIPNMSRPGIKRNSYSHHFINNYNKESGVNCRLRFDQSSVSAETLQNFDNAKRRSGWERVKDVWTSVWMFFQRIVLLVYTTVVTTVTTITKTTISMIKTTSTNTRTMSTKTIINNHNNNRIVSDENYRVKGKLLAVYAQKKAWRPFWFWLIPFLLLLLLFVSHHERDYLENVVEKSGVWGQVLSPLLRLLTLTTDTVFLIGRSLGMVPSLLGQLISLIWYLVLLPFQKISSLVPSILPTMFWYGTTEVPVVQGRMEKNITIDDIRRIVAQILEEHGVVKKVDHEGAIYALDSKIRFLVEDLSGKVKEASAESRRTSDSRLEELKEYVKASEARVETVVSDKLKDGESVRPAVAAILAGGGMEAHLRETIRAALEEKTVGAEKLVKEVVEMERKKENEVIVSSLERWTISESEKIQSQWKSQLEEWVSLVAKLEARIAELEKSSKDTKLMTVELTDLRKTTLESMLIRLKELELLAQAAQKDGVQGEVKMSMLNGTSDNSLLQWTDVQKFILTSIEKVLSKYHADRTGLPDYALQSSGGYVVSIKCTNTYPIAGRKYLFGIPLWDMHTSPDTILKPGIMPGECWAFVGSEGYAVIKLAVKIHITAFTMEHTPKELATHGHIKSAPKDFSVHGLRNENDEDPVNLGSFKFLDNGESLQQFEANNYEDSFDMIELKIGSNHGNLEYTCIYRFRVHGIPVLT